MKKAAIASITTVIIIYLMTAFVETSFNIKDWTECARVLCVFISFILGCAIFGAILND